MQSHKVQISNKSIQGIKAAFFDIDGTIFKSDFSISPSVISTFQKLKSSGIKACLATGRPYFGCAKIINSLNIDTASMFFSGSYVVEPTSQKIVFDCGIPKNDTILFLKELSKENLYTELYTANQYYIEKETSITAMHNQYLEMEPIVGSFDKILDQANILKIVAISNSSEELSKLKEISKGFPNLHHAFSSGASHPNLCFLNVTSQNASREVAFNAMIKHLNVSASETIAFGDSDADIPFIRLAGIGVAVENATEAAKAAADYICPGVEEDGVVSALEYMGLS